MKFTSLAVLCVAISFVLPFSTLVNWLKEVFISLNRPSIEIPTAKQYFLDWNRQKQLNWLRIHQSQCTYTQDVDTVLIGDSITEQWNSVGRENWEKLKKQNELFQKSQTFAIAGDRIENVLFRLQNCSFSDHCPKIFIVLIGTNNLGWKNSPAEVCKGIFDVLKALKSQCSSQIVLMALFPRGQYSSDTLRKAVHETNFCIESNVQYADEYLDLSSAFLDSNGEFKPGITEDYLHFTESAYKIWGDALLSSKTFTRKDIH